MDYGICALSHVPVRNDPSDKSELITELLFGECYTILNREGNWLRVQNAADSYEGWIDFKQNFPVSANYFSEWQKQPHPRSLDMVGLVTDNELGIPILIGSILPFFDGNNIKLGHQSLIFNGRSGDVNSVADARFLLNIARTFLKAPYVWGGRTVFGLDCSGFVQQVYGICNYQLPRDAWQQVAHGEEVHFASQTKPGDLAFFDNAEERIVHVGLMLEGNQIIHAHGEVRIDTLDHQGIYNANRQRYTHRLRIIKRIFPNL
ncbi:hydrolase Nlp/P60 [Adhaeribacter aerolatus]|uniref:Hydrolase Nlp/P60 n=1 Tax=Adhaeribacter aerolatus TaxID=670289 RepID=A0A512B461_9BACT|nr:C40 family peptidase [Adhaeribacter aerolatus]GEO06751.1 hydrolase Nlp/P60 [Adhaeribacter aerolatus]